MSDMAGGAPPKCRITGNSELNRTPPLILTDNERLLLSLGAVAPQHRPELIKRPEVVRCAAIKRHCERLLSGYIGTGSELKELLPQYLEILSIVSRGEVGVYNAEGDYEVERRIVDRLGPTSRRSIRLIPFAIELTDGCSVGCWYCGLSAPRRSGSSINDIGLLANLLASLSDIYCEAGKNGILFWATDPFDAPDYETCCELFYDVWRAWPFLSTALGASQVARLRDHIKWTSERRGCGIRVTANSKRELDILHDEFSAEELMFVNVHIRTPKSLMPLANVGRALDVFQKNQKLARRESLLRQEIYEAEEEAALPGETIACVAGVVINVPRQTMRYVRPIPASDSNMDGFEVAGEEPLEVAKIGAFVKGHRGHFELGTT